MVMSCHYRRNDAGSLVTPSKSDYTGQEHSLWRQHSASTERLNPLSGTLFPESPGMIDYNDFKTLYEIPFSILSF